VPAERVFGAASACYSEAANEGGPVMRAAVMRGARLVVDSLPSAPCSRAVAVSWPAVHPPPRRGHPMPGRDGVAPWRPGGSCS